MGLQAHFLFPINRETPIFTDNGVIEIASTILLIVCLLRCLQYALQSHIKEGRCFWLASVLAFLAIIRRELNHLPDLFISKNFLLLSHSYDWWEDLILLIIYITAIGLFVYARHYLWSLLKKIPIALYISVAVLAVLQYMGENAIMFSKSSGLIVEELSEVAIYGMALFYLLSFKRIDFELQLANQLGFELEAR